MDFFYIGIQILVTKLKLLQGFLSGKITRAPPYFFLLIIKSCLAQRFGPLHENPPTVKLPWSCWTTLTTHCCPPHWYNSPVGLSSQPCYLLAVCCLLISSLPYHVPYHPWFCAVQTPPSSHAIICRPPRWIRRCHRKDSCCPLQSLPRAYIRSGWGCCGLSKGQIVVH